MSIFIIKELSQIYNNRNSIKSRNDNRDDRELSNLYNDKTLIETRNKYENNILKEQRDIRHIQNINCNLMHNFILNTMKNNNLDKWYDIKLDNPINPTKCENIINFMNRTESTLPVKIKFLKTDVSAASWYSSISYDNSINKFICKIDTNGMFVIDQ